MTIAFYEQGGFCMEICTNKYYTPSLPHMRVLLCKTRHVFLYYCNSFRLCRRFPGGEVKASEVTASAESAYEEKSSQSTHGQPDDQMPAPDGETMEAPSKTQS